MPCTQHETLANPGRSSPRLQLSLFGLRERKPKTLTTQTLGPGFFDPRPPTRATVEEVPTVPCPEPPRSYSSDRPTYRRHLATRRQPKRGRWAGCLPTGSRRDVAG